MDHPCGCLERRQEYRLQGTTSVEVFIFYLREAVILFCPDWSELSKSKGLFMRSYIKFS